MTTTTKFRVATIHDKDYVLDFCKKTFSWGDYIEGIRVDPNYRSRKLATTMSLHILDYARKKGAVSSSAIVSINNEASKGLMEKLGFKVISKWSYLSIKPIDLLPELKNFTIENSTTIIKVANLKEYQAILKFLNHSDIFKASGKKFVNAWRWCDLTEDRLKKMINNRQVIILVNNDDNDHEKEKKIRGIAIIDEEGYWNNQNIFQIVYIDAHSDDLLLSLVIKCLEFITLKEENKKEEKNYVENKYERMQIFSPSPIKDNSLIFQKFNITFSEQFLLYHKEI